MKPLCGIQVHFYCTLPTRHQLREFFLRVIHLGLQPCRPLRGFRNKNALDSVFVCLRWVEFVCRVDWKQISCEWAVCRSLCCSMPGETAGKAMNPQILHDWHIYAGFSHLTQMQSVNCGILVECYLIIRVWVANKKFSSGHGEDMFHLMLS